MNKYIKMIIIGFALMIMGGSFLITSAITRANMHIFYVLLTYGLFVGFVMIIYAVIKYPNSK